MSSESAHFGYDDDDEAIILVVVVDVKTRLCYMYIYIGSSH